MKLGEVAEILDAHVLIGADQLDSHIVGAGSVELMEDVLAAAAQGAVLLTGVTDEKVIRTGKLVGIGALVIVRGKMPSRRFIDLARESGLPVLLTTSSMFDASGRLYMNGLRGIDGSW